MGSALGCETEECPLLPSGPNGLGWGQPSETYVPQAECCPWMQRCKECRSGSSASVLPVLPGVSYVA
jgi:hypothetical protein